MVDEPSSAAVDGQSATNQPIPDVIALQHTASAKSELAGENPQGGKRSGWCALRPAKFIPPGAT